MPNTIPSIPAIDANTCGDWTENQITAYQSMPFYLMKEQVEVKKWFPTFIKAVGRRNWKPNQGPIMRGVRTNMSPNVRQFANPRLISQQPLVDVMDIRESTNEAQVRWHQFESPIFNWWPSYNDFMDHIDDNAQDIILKIERFNEMFLRGMIFNMAPFVFICNSNGTVTLQPAPYWSGSGSFDAATQGKTTAFLAAADNKPTGTLTLSAIEMAMTIMETDLRVPFFSGSELPSDDKPLAGKYLIIGNSEWYNNLIYDPIALGPNKPLNMDLLTNGFRGSFFGRATSRLEDLPLTYKVDGTFPEPELRVGAGELNAGETLPNPVFSQLGPNASPYRVAWICGKGGYDAIDVSNPPSKFTGDKFPNAPGMNWAGVPYLNKNFLIQCIASDGTLTYDTNRYGHYLKLQAELPFGIIARQRRNMIPILYLRKRGPGSTIYPQLA